MTRLYQSILGRAPDSAGLAFWTNDLGSAAGSRAAVAATFAASPEAQSANSALFAAGATFGADPNAVAALQGYETVLGRLPDAAGLVAMTQSLAGGSLTLESAYAGLVNSQEFTQRLGGAADSASFVNTIQQTVYGGVSAAATQFWSGLLASGQVTRSDVAQAYAGMAAETTTITPLVTNAGIAHL